MEPGGMLLAGGVALGDLYETLNRWALSPLNRCWWWGGCCGQVDAFIVAMSLVPLFVPNQNTGIARILRWVAPNA